FLLVVLALLAGLVGGGLSARFVFLKPAAVQQDEGLKKVVVAHEFHLVDPDGRDRWVLKLSKDDEPNITFINKNGWAPMAIGVNKNGSPFFNMVLEPAKGEGPSLILMDSDMKNRAILGLERDRGPYLNLLDENGQVRVALGRSEITNPISGQKEERPCSSIILYDEQGEIIWAAPRLPAMPVLFSRNLDQPN
ncbi:MAG: hypothetical protein KKE57_02315, partial [Proteobacteria bacterium]|nr:hypothetical protein [Pseudomonadota bacterium]